jgi:catechol 2,3-dioxygenase-like lactoylglutathione lyase family enzyme
VTILDHIGVVVDDLEAATEFFLDIGLELDGEGSIEGEWVGKIIGLEGVHTDVVYVRTPGGSGKLELIKFRSPPDMEGPHALAANRLGIRHLAFLVDDLDTVLDTLRSKRIETIGTVHNYEDVFRLCYVRGPEGIIVELAERLGSAPA